MHARLSTHNPFGRTPKGMVWQGLAELNSAAHLDFGTHDGTALQAFLSGGLIERGVGLDANAEVVHRHQPHMPPELELRVITPNERIDQPEGTFDTVSAIGVIEHIHAQEAVLRQFHRLLRPGGHLLVAVPGKHLFSFLDMGNFKFVFPRLHKWFYCLWRGREQYERRYVECANGLFGDIEVAKMWHEHFSVGELEALFERCGFQLVKWDGLGFFRRPLVNIAFFLPGPLKRMVHKLIELDARWFHQAELMAIARRVDAQPTASRTAA